MTQAVLSYEDGIPYDFGNKTKNEHFVWRYLPGSSTTVTTVGCTKLINISCSNGKVIPSIIGPPSDEELDVTPVHPYDVCASCGRSRLKFNGSETLLRCSKCKERKYCSKGCQRKNWIFHKPICSRSKEEMEAFLNDIPLDFAGDAHPDYDAIMSESANVVSGEMLGLSIYD